MFAYLVVAVELYCVPWFRVMSVHGVLLAFRPHAMLIVVVTSYFCFCLFGLFLFLFTLPAVRLVVCCAHSCA